MIGACPDIIAREKGSIVRSIAPTWSRVQPLWGDNDHNGQCGKSANLIKCWVEAMCCEWGNRRKPWENVGEMSIGSTLYTF